MRYFITKLTLLLIIFLPNWSSAQNLNDTISSVFLMGENEEYYERLSQQYNQTLLSATNNDMNKAYELWMQMQRDMELFAEKLDFNLVGVKLWMHVYWAPDGKLDYISFFPKPNSLNVPTQELRAFFLSFQRQYYSPVQTQSGFSHYASVHFPTSMHDDSDKQSNNQGY